MWCCCKLAGLALFIAFFRPVVRETVTRMRAHLPIGANFSNFPAKGFFLKKMCHKQIQPSISRFS